VRVGDLAQGRQVAGRRQQHAAFPLHRLDQDRDGRGGDRFAHRFGIVVGDEPEARGHRLEPLTVARVAGGRERGEGAAVERVVGHQDLVGLRSPDRLAALPGELDRGLVGFRTAVAEEGAGESGKSGQPARRLDLLRDLVEVRDVHVARGLPGDRADEPHDELDRGADDDRAARQRVE